MGSEALRAAERDPASQRRTPPSVGRAVSLPRLTRRGPHLASDWKPPEGLVNNADPRVPAPTPSAENSMGESQMLAWNRLPGRSWAQSVGTRARARAGRVRAVEVLIHSFTHSLTHSFIRSFIQDSLGTQRWVSRPGPSDRGTHILTGAVQEADGTEGLPVCVCVAGGQGVTEGRGPGPGAICQTAKLRRSVRDHVRESSGHRKFPRPHREHN